MAKKSTGPHTRGPRPAKTTRVLGATMRQLPLAIAAILMTLVGLQVYLSRTSGEAQIRKVVERMEVAFNEGSVESCIAPIARDWAHDHSDLTRDGLRGVLEQRVFVEKDAHGRPLLRAETSWLDIEVENDIGLATVVVGFQKRSAERWELYWAAQFEVELRNGEAGWRIHRTRHVDLEGTKAPFR